MRRSVAVYAAARPLWQPGGTPPAHLDGSLPGDFGFDPLNLGANKAALEWCVSGLLFLLVALEHGLDIFGLLEMGFSFS